jgi:hypothetical protein
MFWAHGEGWGEVLRLQTFLSALKSPLDPIYFLAPARNLNRIPSQNSAKAGSDRDTMRAAT